jgi:hypothetical protein
VSKTGFQRKQSASKKRNGGKLLARPEEENHHTSSLKNLTKDFNRYKNERLHTAEMNTNKEYN